jgi:YhcH/YjgK/YiaL family protein
MILDTIQNHFLYENLHPFFKSAFKFISENKLVSLSDGKHEISGDDIFVIVQTYQTKDVSDCVMENHRKYIDIQYMVEGAELMGISLFSGQIPTTPYDDSKDAAFYPREYSNTIKVDKGRFAIFFPGDLHMPCISTGIKSVVKKAVFKVRV